MPYLKIFGIISLFYSFIYFLIRGMLSLFLQKISLNLSLEISSLIAIFNLSYCFIQIFNGYLIDRFGLKIIAISSLSLGGILFLLDLPISSILAYGLISLLGICCSFATLNITFFVSQYYNSSLTTLGFLRFAINILVGFVISNFKLPNLNTNLFIIIISLFCGICLFFSSKYFSKKSSEEVVVNSKRTKCDIFFIFLCINGIISASPYFFINSGFINSLFINDISEIMAYLIYGFGFGNLFVMISEYINQRLIIILLCVLQFLSLYGLLYKNISIYICIFFIGASYACHIIPVMQITKRYENPFFLAGFYNFIIMFFASSVFIKLISMYIYQLGNNSSTIYNLIYFFIVLSGFNIFFSIFLYIFDKKFLKKKDDL